MEKIIADSRRKQTKEEDKKNYFKKTKKNTHLQSREAKESWLQNKNREGERLLKIKGIVDQMCKLIESLEDGI